MRIAHVITRLILGGAQENTVLTCEGLASRGHDVTLITGPPLGPEGQLLDRAMAGGYRVIVVDALQRPIHPIRDRASYRALIRHFKQLNLDIMHSHSSKAGILARRAAARCGVPIIVHSIHGLPFHPYQPWWLNRMFIGLERRAARQSDAILCVADSMTQQALAAGVGQPELFTTVYSGMEVERFTQRPAAADAFRGSLHLPPDGILVTQVARLAELKGQEYLVEAAQSLPEHIHFCLVGDGALQRQLEKQIRQAGLTDRFHLTGLLDPADIPAVMHASDIVAHCSLHEGLARTLPQALLTGTPVVSFDIDGAPEVVVNGETGFLVPATDVPALTSALLQLANDPTLRRTLGAQGCDRVKDLFSTDAMVDHIDKIYGQLAARKGL